MYWLDFVLSNLQILICYKAQEANQLNNQQMHFWKRRLYSHHFYLKMSTHIAEHIYVKNEFLGTFVNRKAKKNYSGHSCIIDTE